MESVAEKEPEIKTRPNRYFTKRIMCRREVQKDRQVVAEISRMLYNYNKKKFNIADDTENLEDIIREHAYSLTLSLSSGNRGFFSRVLFRKQNTKPYSVPVGFALGSFDDVFKFATLDSLYIDDGYEEDDLEEMLIDAFRYWAKIMEAKKMYMQKCKNDNGIISELLELKKEGIKNGTGS
jgi:hypothetical protein